MTTSVEIVRAAIPGADERLCDHILWGRTPFPIGGITAKSLFRAASAFRRAHEHGFQLCDHCHNPAEPGKFECRRCRAALSRGIRNG